MGRQTPAQALGEGVLAPSSATRSAASRMVLGASATASRPGTGRRPTRRGRSAGRSRGRRWPARGGGRVDDEEGDGGHARRLASNSAFSSARAGSATPVMRLTNVRTPTSRPSASWARSTRSPSGRALRVEAQAAFAVAVDGGEERPPQQHPVGPLRRGHEGGEHLGLVEDVGGGVDPAPRQHGAVAPLQPDQHAVGAVGRLAEVDELVGRLGAGLEVRAVHGVPGTGRSAPWPRARGPRGGGRPPGASVPWRRAGATGHRGRAGSPTTGPAARPATGGRRRGGRPAPAPAGPGGPGRLRTSVMRRAASASARPWSSGRRAPRSGRPPARTASRAAAQSATAARPSPSSMSSSARRRGSPRAGTARRCRTASASSCRASDGSDTAIGTPSSEGGRHRRGTIDVGHGQQPVAGGTGVGPRGAAGPPGVGQRACRARRSAGAIVAVSASASRAWRNCTVATVGADSTPVATPSSKWARSSVADAATAAATTAAGAVAPAKRQRAQRSAGPARPGGRGTGPARGR